MDGRREGEKEGGWDRGKEGEEEDWEVRVD